MNAITLQNRIVEILLFAGLLLYIFYLLRSNRLSGQHAVVWIFAEIVIFIAIFVDPIQLFIMRLIGTDNVYFSFFLLAFIWLMVLILDLLVRVSELSRKLTAVNQELALLNERVERSTKSNSDL
jgi:hypothetical protein